MDFKVDVEKSNFAALRESGNYYVDKTEFIYELVDRRNKVTLITRPRRFGKTLMLSMLENFFSIQKDSKHIFEGLAITKHEEFCKEWMNQYPVIYISFKEVFGQDFDDAYNMLKVQVANVCKDLENVIVANVTDKYVLNKFYKLKSELGSNSDMRDSLKTLMGIMHDIYGKRVILLIDEYDVPIAKANERNTAENEYYLKMQDIMDGITSSSLKGNEYLKFALVTGHLYVVPESIYSGANNLVPYSVLDEGFSSFFGFSEDEVEKMLEVADRKEAAPKIKEWYGGYIFGDSYVYCPWDIMNYLSAIKDDRTAEPKNYWKDTSLDKILLTFLKQTKFRVVTKFETLMEGKTIRRTIPEGLTYRDLYSSEGNFWSALLINGYVTKADANDDDDTVSLKIPNKELLSIFEDAAIKYFEESVDTGMVQELINILWDGNESQAGEIFSKLLRKTVAYNNYHENYYHTFLVKVFSNRGYNIEFNEEPGLDRPDIILTDQDNGKVIIIEKRKSDNESDMDKDADEAINQIVTKKYAEGIENCKHIIYCGISFFWKQAKVKLMKR